MFDRSVIHGRAAAWLAGLVAALLVPFTARAATDTSTFAVTATVIGTCSVSASPLAFGNYAMSQLDSTTAVTVLCTNGTTYTVSLNAGIGAGATMASRKLTSAASGTLNYALYQDVGRVTLWGNTIATDTVAGTGSGATQTLTVYGRIFGAQGNAAGAYADTITVTLTY